MTVMRDDAGAPDLGDFANRLVSGGSFVLDAPADVPAVWGRDSEVLWARGESLILAGPPGVGKTTLTGQIARGLLGLDGAVLGYPIAPAAGRVLYLAMDRPQQIARSLRRHFVDDERDVLERSLAVWSGPPPADLARRTEILATLADRANASHVIIDSLKDAALGLTDDEVGSGYNRARQFAIARGVELLELHHVVKRGANGARPNTLADLYGSAWITAGAGSVVLLWGAAGDPIVDLTQLKSPAEPVGPLRVTHDHEHGVSSIWHASDPLSIVRLAGTAGITAAALATAMFETDKPDRNQHEKARRKLQRLVDDGLAEKITGQPAPGGGPDRTAYRARTLHAREPYMEDASTVHARTHGDDETPGQARTHPRTSRTRANTHAGQPPFRGVAARDTACPDCGEPLNRPGFLQRCQENHETQETA